MFAPPFIFVDHYLTKIILHLKLIERFKSSFQISKSNWVFEKGVALKYSLRLPQLEYTRFPRAANEPPRGLSSRWSLAYSSCWAGFSFSTNCFTIPILPIIIYLILSFVNSSATSLIGTEGGDSSKIQTNFLRAM